MPISGIIRLATFLIDRKDKANEDIAALLEQLAMLSEDIATKWAHNLEQVERLKFGNNRIIADRRNSDYFSQLFERGVDVRTMASATRSNSASVYDAKELMRSIPDEITEKIEQSAEIMRKFSDVEKADVNHAARTPKKRKKKNGNAFEESRRAVSSLLRSRSQLRMQFDELFDGLEEEHGNNLSDKLSKLEIEQLERKVEGIQKQAAKVKAQARYYRAQIR